MTNHDEESSCTDSVSLNVKLWVCPVSVEGHLCAQGQLLGWACSSNALWDAMTAV